MDCIIKDCRVMENGAEKIIETPTPSVGLVIGTFAAIPYVHLALESARRNTPGLPVLISDDCSPNADALHALCEQYGAQYKSAASRLRPTVGDMAAYVNGMDWAKQKGLDIVVKMSRRFIPFYNWIPSLQALAYETQYATYSQRCTHYNFGFRTECIGFHIGSWKSRRCDIEKGGGRDESQMNDSGVNSNSGYDAIAAHVIGNKPVFVEGFIHQLARRRAEAPCIQNARYQEAYPRPPEANAYGIWDIMPESRVQKKADLLWHDSHNPADYARAAQGYGLAYTEADFADPNMGFGNGTEA